MKFILTSVLIIVLAGVLFAQDQISQDLVFAEVGRLTILVKVLNERVAQLEKENKSLQEKLSKYEKPSEKQE